MDDFRKPQARPDWHPRNSHKPGMAALAARKLDQQIAQRPRFRCCSHHRLARVANLAFDESFHQEPEVLFVDQVLGILSAVDEGNHPSLHALGQPAEHASGSRGSVAIDEARAHDEGARGNRGGLDLELCATVRRSGTFKRADRGHDRDPLHPAGLRRREQLPRSLDVDPLNLGWLYRAEVISAVNKSRDLAAAEHIWREVFAKSKRNCARVAGAGGVRNTHHLPTRLFEMSGQHRTDKTACAGDRDPCHQSSAVLPILWAFAITLRVMVVAGNDGKTLESTRCTREKPVGRPSRSA